MGNIKMTALAAIALLVACLHHVEAQQPDQGFYLISGFPERSFNSEQYVYAIQTDTMNAGDTIEIGDRNLPSESGNIMATANFGRYLRIHPPGRGAGNLYGVYPAEFRAMELGAEDPGVCRETFFKRKSRLLDTRGYYTVTVYPAAVGQPELSEDSPETIGVKFTPGCRKIMWCKDRARNVFTGQRLELKSVEDAGLYTLRRRLRGRRGWFAQIRVIAATCPRDQFWNVATGACAARVTAPTCMNGGVPKDREDACLCPPFLVGATCANAVEPVDDDPFVLATSGANSLRCEDLPGSNPRCRGCLFCLGDLYGCSCGAGWQGNSCERPCAKGQWGAGCSQRCPADNRACDPFFGEVEPAD